jgi:hypothetical protein
MVARPRNHGNGAPDQISDGLLVRADEVIE